MSDIILTTVAQMEAKKKLKEVIEEYNDPQLTMKGKREVLEMALFTMFLKGYKFNKIRHKNDQNNNSKG